MLGATYLNASKLTEEAKREERKRAEREAVIERVKEIGRKWCVHRRVFQHLNTPSIEDDLAAAIGDLLICD